MISQLKLKKQHLLLKKRLKTMIINQQPLKKIRNQMIKLTVMKINHKMLKKIKSQLLMRMRIKNLKKRMRKMKRKTQNLKNKQTQ